MILIDGMPVSSIPADDRSFQYGDGCFSTILTIDGQMQHWLYHQQRMEACLTILQIPYPDWDDVARWMSQVIVAAPKAGIKIHISRGSGGRGYSPNAIPSPRVTVQSFDYPNHYEALLSDGVRLGICQQRLGHNPLLAGHKHNNRLEQVLLKAEAERAGCMDAVALDLHDQVIETTMANLFWFRDNVLHTPDLTLAGVAGVMRRVVLDIATQQGIMVNIGHFSVDDMLGADEVFMTNSILGVAPVVQIQSAYFVLGERVRDLQKRVNRC
ncbi:Aminodeoxychorismate lyase [Vibrio ruber DSM 16370]|uniref:Aminodeoxychorismate lyase n=1 Tax=Vibrio ruber (strain DSM 16370 / JCM 11486 / BCRC 17186 / CECT 7878 / LMG 23124 / VR1) TaxID=1123498 RepID=A0A1R4LFT1_VIBR1|nr:aminodeoxychorismate lyase [Vibrio ruber]SJN55431.1 Aminodeoxychorismate lyase [Vibrio ruber DSM 16370]